MRALLAKGADVNARYKDGRTALTFAAANGFAAVADGTAGEGRGRERARRRRVDAALWASWFGHADVVKLLLERGANAATIDRDKDTPLMKAATQGHVAVVRLLVGAKGVDVNARGNGGGTALLFSASRPSGYETVEALLAKGADVNARNDAGMTAVILASAYGRVPTLEVLFEKGGDVNARTPKGFSALIAAANKGLAATVQLLIENGAEVNAKYEDGRTALGFAEENGQTKSSRYSRAPAQDSRKP